MKHAPISPIYRMGEREPDPPEISFGRAWRIRRDAWVNHGIVAVSPDELPEGLRAGLTEWADAQYGEKKRTELSFRKQHTS